jgi:very-short-patch-repair endonuclease/predicted transcriptional regulator of viral defense system
MPGANLRACPLLVVMTTKKRHAKRPDFWSVVRRQQGVITRPQLLRLGYTSAAIRHRLETGWLHPLFRGVYAVGRPEVTREGLWMAGVLSCGAGAVLSHRSAASLWGIRPYWPGEIEVTVAARRQPRRPGVRVHRSRTLAPSDITRRNGIPVTTPVRTLMDSAPSLTGRQLERAINEADRLGLADVERLRRALDDCPRTPGAAVLRKMLDPATFARTRSGVESDFLGIARRAGLPKPLTLQIVNGYEVDFYWPDLGLVVETDSWLHHRTPFQQARDRERDQAHTAAGLTCLRFTDVQIKYEPAHVERTLRAVAGRLAAA